MSRNLRAAEAMASWQVPMIGCEAKSRIARMRRSMNLSWPCGGNAASTSSVRPCGDCCIGSGCHIKKDLRASEQKRPDVAKDRAIWKTRRQPFMRDHLERLVFIDETSLKTNMTKTTGWAPEGTRLIDHAPGGHWNTQTFIAGLRHDRIDATGVISGPMDKEMFDLYVEGILAPTLRAGDVFGLGLEPVAASSPHSSTTCPSTAAQSPPAS